MLVSECFIFLKKVQPSKVMGAAVCFSNLSVHGDLLEVLIKHRWLDSLSPEFLILEVWDGAWECAPLTGSQVRLCGGLADHTVSSTAWEWVRNTQEAYYKSWPPCLQAWGIWPIWSGVWPRRLPFNKLCRFWVWWSPTTWSEPQMGHITLAENVIKVINCPFGNQVSCKAQWQPSLARHMHEHKWKWDLGCELL